MMPADQTSIAVTISTAADYEALDLRTNSLIRTFEQDLGSAEASSTSSIGLDCRPLIILQEPDPAFAHLRTFTSVVHSLLDD